MTLCAPGKPPARREAYPFPDDHRIFLREWPVDSVSQNGQLGSEPARPVFLIHGPQGVDKEAKRKMLKKVDQAVADAYRLPEFMIFMQEYPLDLVAHEGGCLRTTNSASKIKRMSTADRS